MKKKYKVIFWDFDGVLMDSNSIRDLGFETVLKGYPQEQVKVLMDFHRKNFGLSRYVKFRYFFENIREEKVSEGKIQKLAQKFSEIMKDLMINPDLLIQDSLNYVKKNHKEKRMHIVSGSDQEELRFLCKELKIDRYFNSIHGSPTPKKKLVKEIILENQYNIEECILIGDSINDYDAAEDNKIVFYGYNLINDRELKLPSENIIVNFSV